MSEVRASHLLVKHQGSRRPASWRDPDGAVITKRSKAAALDELEAYREQIESGAVTFADLAAKVSDCSSAKHGGDLGFFGPGKMQKAFEVRRNTPQRCSQHVVDSLSTNRLIWFSQTKSAVLVSPAYLTIAPPTTFRFRTERSRFRWVRCPASWTPIAACTSSSAPRERGQKLDFRCQR